jgi:hypothetical protein
MERCISIFTENKFRLPLITSAQKETNTKKKKLTKTVLEEKLIEAFENDVNAMFTELEKYGLYIYSHKCKNVTMKSTARVFSDNTNYEIIRQKTVNRTTSLVMNLTCRDSWKC